MAKHELHNGDADLDRALDTRVDVGADDDSGSEGLRVRTLIFLQGRYGGAPNDPVVNRTEATTADESGLLETTTIRLKAASGCGHILHVGQEMGLQCTSCIRLPPHSRPLAVHRRSRAVCGRSGWRVLSTLWLRRASQ